MCVSLSAGESIVCLFQLVTQSYQNLNSSQLLFCTSVFSKRYGSYWKTSSSFTSKDNLGKFDSGVYLACTACMPGDSEICFNSLPCCTCKFKWVLLFDSADIAQAVGSFCHARQEPNRPVKSVLQGDLTHITTGMTS